MRGHEHPSSTFRKGTFPSEAVDFAVLLNLVEPQGGELDFGVLVLDFLGGGVVLLLPFLTTSPQSEHQMKGGLLLDVVVGQGPAIFRLLAGEDQTLLVWWDTFFVLDLSLDIFNGIRGLNLKSNGLAS